MGRRPQKSSESGFRIRLDRVTARDGERVLFRNLSWTIEPGQQWVVFGGNGSGKTSLARLLAGERIVPRGSLRFELPGSKGDGAGDCAGVSPDELPDGSIALVSCDRERALFDAWTPYIQARWNSLEDEHGPRVRDLLPREGSGEYREELVRTLDLKQLLPRRIIQLSSGERRRVLVAQALLKRPRLVLFDGPGDGLDPSCRRKLLRAMDRLMRGGTQVIVLTSRRDEIPSRATHLMLLEGRRPVASGPIGRMWKLLPRDSTPEVVPGKKATRSRPAGEALVAMRDVRVTYGRVQVLRGCTWTVRAGENWLIHGPNGSGKSTLLGLVAGDHPQAYANDITLFGRPRGSGETIWEVKKRLGWVAPQLAAYFPRTFRCLDVVLTGFSESTSTPRELPRDAVARSRAWLKRVGLGRLEGSLLGELSDGEQLLVLLARALVKDPLLLLLDEPCRGLDARHRDRILALLDRIAAKGGPGYVYVTHHPEERPSTVTHVLELCRGRIRRKGALF